MPQEWEPLLLFYQDSGPGYGSIHGSWQERKGTMQNLRTWRVFPYHGYAGVQALTLEPDGIYEYGERSMARHLYGDLKSAVHTRDCLYLIKRGWGKKSCCPWIVWTVWGNRGRSGWKTRENQSRSRFVYKPVPWRCNGRRPPSASRTESCCFLTPQRRRNGLSGVYGYVPGTSGQTDW